jgi:hypothetical protein
MKKFRTTLPVFLLVAALSIMAAAWVPGQWEAYKNALLTGAYEGKFTATTTIGANGQAVSMKMVSTTVNSVVGTTLTATNLIPAGSMVVGVCVRVTTGFGETNGLTTLSIGDGTDADRWGAGIAHTAGTTTGVANFTITGPVYYTAATHVVITGAGDGGNEFDATGQVRVTVYYFSLTAPTS